MGSTSEDDGSLEGWGWFEADLSEVEGLDKDDLARCFARCFSGNDGASILLHLRQTIIDRRLGPGASDAELRFLEGQRSIAAHIQSMVERGSS